MREHDNRVMAIMMKAPRAGGVKTRLEPAYRPEAIVALYRALVEDTIDLARLARVPTVVVCPAGDEAEIVEWLSDGVAVVPQRGSGLAAGLFSTFEQLCGASGRHVVAFNADSPHLPATVLESAFAALATQDLVVGPCDDGGYYLVGAKQPHDELFEAASMGEGSACEALLARAARLGLRTSLMAEHYDIDVPGDVVRLATELSTDPGRAPRTAAILAAWGVAGRPLARM
jgi:rSAM/selenodomain-associated transferase 1